MIPIYYAIAIVIGLAVVVLMLEGYQDCTDLGGEYVRGMFWFKCIEQTP